MPTPRLSLVAAVLLAGCVRNPSPARAPLEEDTSIVFPQFFEQDAVAVGARNEPYELDGELLRALTIAANDFLPPENTKAPCSSKQEAQFYRVIRQGDVIFVYVYENPAYCGRQYPALDSGAKYAISKDGRILRRVMDGQPESPLGPTGTLPGDGGFSAEPGVSPTFEATWNDGGTPPSGLGSPSAPSATRDGGTPAADAGSPPTP